MKKAVTILIILALIGFGIYKNIQKQKVKAEREKVKIEKQMKKVDFHNYPVKNDPKQIAKYKAPNTNTKINTNSGSNVIERSTINNPTKAAQLIGNKIPDWVYENTSSSDKYYSLIHSQTNFVFTSYADCPIGQRRKSAVSNAIAKAGVSGNFLNKVELMPTGSSVQATCSKTYQGNMCYAKQNEKKEGTCKCAIHYLLDNCMNQYCIVNPTQKRIAFVSATEEELTAKLKELKNNW